MNIFKNLLLTILGWFRVKSNSKVDLRYAGVEHSAQIKSKIDSVVDQRNAIAASGLIIKNKIKEQQSNVNSALDAIKHHATTDNEELKNKAYNHYVNLQSNLDLLLADEAEYDSQVEALDKEIATLQREANDAKNTLAKAASRQVVGKAMTSVENIHKDLTSGPLSEVIEQSDHQSAVAQVRRDQRKAEDKSDVYSYKNTSNVKSLEDILASK